MTLREAGERVAPLLVAGLLAIGSALGVTAQDPESFISSCTASGGFTSECVDGAVTGRAMFGAIGLAAAGGVAVPGTATTLGSRVGGGPRISPFFSVGRSGGGTTAATDADLATGVTSIRGGVALGLFDGLRIMPTVGGFLSVDLIATGSIQLLPDGIASSGRVRTFGAGLRLGILREGFSVPGISISIAQRYSEEATQTRTPDAFAVRVDPTTTSVRAVVGKDAGGVELLAGLGWDGYSGTVYIPQGVAGPTLGGGLDGSRMLYFGGVSTTLSIVLSLSAEVGWTGGFDPVAAYTGPFDPTAGTAFGSIAARLIL